MSELLFRALQPDNTTVPTMSPTNATPTVAPTMAPTSNMTMSPTTELLFCDEAGNSGDFPCDLNTISLVSLGIAGGGIALLFVVYLYLQVCALSCRMLIPSSWIPFTHSHTVSHTRLLSLYSVKRQNSSKRPNVEPKLWTTSPTRSRVEPEPF